MKYQVEVEYSFESNTAPEKLVTYSRRTASRLFRVFVNQDDVQRVLLTDTESDEVLGSWVAA